LLIVLIAVVDSFRTNVFFNSGTYIDFFWRLTLRLTMPVGLNWVARVRLLYPPALKDVFFVIAQILDMFFT